LPNTARISTIDDVTEAFKKIDSKETGSLDVDGIELVAELLNHPCTSAELQVHFILLSLLSPAGAESLQFIIVNVIICIHLLQTCFESISKDTKKDRITLEELFEWWNSSSANPYLAKMETAAAIAIY
jgi:Ca2+-binding EF-hand superfamily protein